MSFLDLKEPPGGWFLGLQVAFAVLVTIGLSIWQVGRGFEKLEHKQNFEENLVKPPVQESDWLVQSEDFRPVQLKGTIDPIRYFVIANQRHQGRTGYWVIGVLNTEQERYLVNRGWLSYGSNVRNIPSIEPIPDTVAVTGIAWPTEPRRSNTLTSNPTWPITLPDLDIGQMARLTGARAKEIRLKCCHPAVFQPAPLQLEFATAMHWGYAAQWIFIGLLVLGGYWFFTIRKDKESEDS